MSVQRAGFTLDLSGLAAVRTAAQARSITLKAVKAGAKLVQAAAKARAPKRSGALKQSIGIKSQKGTRSRTAAYAIVGARVKVQKSVKPLRGKKKVVAVPAKYAHLVEKGTKPHGGHPGTQPRPFLRPAFDSVKGQAIDAGAAVIAAELQKIIAREAAKLNRG